MNEVLISKEWREKTRPSRLLERRIEFPDYPSLSKFLQDAADLSEKEGFYPDMGFGRNYVNITIHIDDDDTEKSQKFYLFTQKLDELLGEKADKCA